MVPIFVNRPDIYARVGVHVTMRMEISIRQNTFLEFNLILLFNTKEMEKKGILILSS